MKTIVLGRNARVDFELSTKPSGEPFVKEVLVFNLDEEFVVKELDDNFEISVDEVIYITKDESVRVTEIRKTFEGIKYVYTNYVNYIENEEEKQFCQTLLQKKLPKFANSLLERYPNIGSMMELMNIEKTPENIIKTVKSFNGTKNDFFGN